MEIQSCWQNRVKKTESESYIFPQGDNFIELEDLERGKEEAPDTNDRSVTKNVNTEWAGKKKKKKQKIGIISWLR